MNSYRAITRIFFLPTLHSSYPATHVHLYTLIYRLTNRGHNLRLAQYLFAGIYLITMAIVLAIYKSIPEVTRLTRSCGRSLGFHDLLYYKILMILDSGLVYPHYVPLKTTSFHLFTEIVQ
jgi:hypothetical protein